MRGPRPLRTARNGPTRTRPVTTAGRDKRHRRDQLSSSNDNDEGVQFETPLPDELTHHYRHSSSKHRSKRDRPQRPRPTTASAIDHSERDRPQRSRSTSASATDHSDRDRPQRTRPTTANAIDRSDHTDPDKTQRESDRNKWCKTRTTPMDNKKVVPKLRARTEGGHEREMLQPPTDWSHSAADRRRELLYVDVDIGTDVVTTAPTAHSAIL